MTHTEVPLDRLAGLASLRLSPPDAARLAKDLPRIVELIDELQAARSQDVAATNQVTDLENVYRPDEVDGYEHHRTLVDLAPDSQAGLIRVPGVFASSDHGE